MFNFLRKLRRKEIEGTGPTYATGRYLKYALGEILLVVIGILIALSINTWTENRKRGFKEKGLLIELKQAFRGDEEDLGRLISGFNFLKGHLDTLLLLGEGQLAYDNSRNKHFGALNGSLSFTPRTGPYETLKGLGLDLITNNELRQLISSIHDFEFMNYRDGIAAGLETDVAIIKGFTFENFKDEGFKNGINIYSPYDFEQIKNNGQLTSVANRMIGINNVKFYHAQRLQELIRRVINNIDAELD